MVAVVLPPVPNVLGSPSGSHSQIVLEAQHIAKAAYGPNRKLSLIRCRLDQTGAVETALAERLWEACVQPLDDLGGGPIHPLTLTAFL